MRKIIKFDSQWKFFRGDLPPVKDTDNWGGAKARAYDFGAASEKYDDSQWRCVDLPHDFVAEGEYCFKNSASEEVREIPEMESIGNRLLAGGCLEGGVAWYRKWFKADKSLADKRIYVYFDGVYRDSTLYVNQYYVGTHKSGYTGFYYDITDFITLGRENIIAVRVDASEREGWWYEGGGIYRDVRIEIVDNIHIEPDGVFVTAKPNLKNGTAEIEISANILNRYFEEKSVWVEAEIKNSDGHTVSRLDRAVSIKGWDRAGFSDSEIINNVKLWDIDDPNLYSAKLRLYYNENVCDEYTLSFGIRDIRFNPDSGFYLNGKNIKIKGLCCHHDHAGMGIAVTKSVNEYRIQQMKSMGANAIRSSHYPAAPELLDICDREGMLVFEETRRMSSAPEDIERLKSMIKRDRNHPSIFLWGIGNEEIFSQHRSETALTTLTMKAEIKKLDPTRPITSAVVCWDGEQRYDNARMYMDVTKNLDVMGFNYCANAWDDYHTQISNQPVIITEASSNSGTRGCYSTDEAKGHYFILDDENRNKCLSGEKAVKKDVGENTWKKFAESDYLSGIFLWTGMDYRGEPTPLRYPAVYSQFGIFDYCGFPKDNYYYYKSWWQNENVLHIFPHWNFVDKIGERVNVYCYSNLDEAEIFVNGKSYGKKAIEKNGYLKWDNVTYETGMLTAKGYKNNTEVITKNICTTGEPYKINAQLYKDNISISDTAIINISVEDKDGNIVPTADNKIKFEISGNGSFIGCGNGNPGDHDSDFIPERRAFNGLCQVLIKAEDKGRVKVELTSEELAGCECTINVI